MGDSRSAAFTGLGQIELDAVPPETLQEWAQVAVDDNFSNRLFEQLRSEEERERSEYQAALREYVATL